MAFNSHYFRYGEIYGLPTEKPAKDYFRGCHFVFHSFRLYKSVVFTFQEIRQSDSYYRRLGNIERTYRNASAVLKHKFNFIFSKNIYDNIQSSITTHFIYIRVTSFTCINLSFRNKYPDCIIRTLRHMHFVHSFIKNVSVCDPTAHFKHC